MAEYIDKTEIIKAIVAEASHCLVLDKPAEARGYIGAKELIERRKAADVAEVVRCQDCKYRIYKDMGDDIGMIGGCQVWGVALPGDFYCAHGARMDKEDEHGSEFD
jgi:hypothetical protein